MTEYQSKCDWCGTNYKAKNVCDDYDEIFRDEKGDIVHAVKYQRIPMNSKVIMQPRLI